MSSELLATLSYIFISSFTPGPSNISSAGMGALYGYRKSLKYLAGMVAGFFAVMLVCGLVAAFVLDLLPQVEPVLRYIGAAYILYLAYGIMRAGYAYDEENTKPLGFWQGVVLQILNPKLFVYGLTLFSTFLAALTDRLVLCLVVAGLAVVAFSAVSAWALFGAAMKSFLRRPKARLAVNIGLALLLVYSALELAQVLKG